MQNHFDILLIILLFFNFCTCYDITVDRGTPRSAAKPRYRNHRIGRRLIPLTKEVIDMMNYMSIMPINNIASQIAEDVGAPELRNPLNSGIRTQKTLLDRLVSLFVRNTAEQ